MELYLCMECLPRKEYELQLCEKCGAVVGTKKHLLWLNKKLGPLAYTNPSLLLSQDIEMQESEPPPIQPLKESKGVTANDFMKILCPKCKCELNIQL